MLSRAKRHDDRLLRVLPLPFSNRVYFFKHNIVLPRFSLCTLTRNVVVFGRPTFDGEAQQESTKLRVLLLDEVDVFFSDSFYGRLYRACHCIRHDACAEILHHVWTRRLELGEGEEAVQELLKTPQVARLLDAFPGVFQHTQQCFASGRVAITFSSTCTHSGVF